MWNDTERLSIRRPRRFVPTVLLGLLLAALVVVPLTAPVAAQEDAPAASTPSTAAGAAGGELAARVAAAYEVLPVRGGVLLRPRREYRGVRAIEIAEGSVAINGEAVPDEAVRGWLGPRADDVLAVAAMTPEERQALVPEGVPEVPEVPEVPTASSAESTTVTVATSTDTGTGETAGTDGSEGAEESASVEPPPIPSRPVEPPSAPRARRGSQTGFGSNVYVAPDEVVDDVVVLGGSVTIDGRVDGDAVVVGGRLEINGEVDQNAAVIGGSMVLGPKADIGGDVSVVGGSLDREPGARIGGKIEQVERGWHLAPLISPGAWGPTVHTEWRGWSPWSEVGELFWALGTLVLCGLLIAIVIAIARSSVEAISYRIGREPIKAGLVGLLVAVLWMPVFIVVSALLVISIIGIPIFVILLLAFIFIGVPALLVIGLVGYATVSHRAGLWLGERFGWHLDNPFAAAFVGLVGLNVLVLVGRLLDLFGGPVDFFAAMFLFVGWAVQLIACCIGYGAVFLHLWDRRSGAARARAAAAPLPPIPTTPYPEPADPVAPVAPVAPTPMEDMDGFWDDKEPAGDDAGPAGNGGESGEDDERPDEEK